MFIRYIFFAFAFLLIGTDQQTTQGGNNFVFDLADLTLDYQTDSGWITIEAFKSSFNDLIIERKDSEKYGQLNWLSIGYPQLILFPSTLNDSILELLRFKPEGFEARVDMLTNRHRNLFKDLVKKRYKIDITEDQIVNLIPSRFLCQLAFYDENNKILINGKVNNLNSFPLRISFLAPKKSKERTLFEKRIKNDGNMLDLEIQCQISSQGQIYKQNTLIITGKQVNQLGITDEIFGTAENVYVTRKQTNDLSSDLYQRLNIIEEYQIPESQFSSNFIDDFIKQTSSSILQYVNIDEALNSLSEYDFKTDLKPNIIKEELSKILVVNKTGSKDHIVLDNNYYEHLKTNSHLQGQAEAEGDFIDLFSASASASFVSDKASDWQKSTKNVDDQLRELNSYYKNDIQWQRKGDIIEPKNIKVSRLSRSSFSKNLIFSRIKKEYYEAPFTRSFGLYTFNKLYPSSTILENSQRLAEIEKNLTNITSQLIHKDIEIKNLTLKLDNLTTDLQKAKQSLSENITNSQSLINEKITDLSKSLDRVSLSSKSLVDSTNSLRGEISKRTSGCRICFRETEGSSQCQGHRYTCTAFAGTNSPSPGWTDGFRDDTDNRGGGCNYSWTIDCAYG